MEKRKLVTNLHFKEDEWNITETSFDPAKNQHEETVFSLGNGYIASRGFFEEGFSADTTPLTYIAGVFEDFDYNVRFMKGKKVLPIGSHSMVVCPNPFSIKLTIDNESFDMAESTYTNYNRTLNMKDGILSRTFQWTTKTGKQTHVAIEKFYSTDQFHIAAIRYKLTPMNYSGTAELEVLSGITVPKHMKDWDNVEILRTDSTSSFFSLKTKFSGFTVANAQKTTITCGDTVPELNEETTSLEVGSVQTFRLQVQENKEYTLEKITSIYTSRDTSVETLQSATTDELNNALATGYEGLLCSHRTAWNTFWEERGLTIEGDIATLQGLRYCMFQFNEAYRGNDPGVNIGSKGLASGCFYYWDTEIYMLPYFIYTNPSAAKNLILYRYYTLDQARDISKVWGYPGAKYPWMTLNGEDIPFAFWDCIVGEIHINAAICYSIAHYCQMTGDTDLLVKYGTEMLIELCRFYAARVTYHKERDQYLINNVTGPDEYTPFVNNNAYTNTMVQWSLRYAASVAEMMKEKYQSDWKGICNKISFDENELAKWHEIANKMYIPFDETKKMHLQDDNFLNLEQINILDIPDEERPLEDKWPFEKVMRFNVIKQPDVVLLMHLLNDNYPLEVKKNNYDYYEPKTIHDSSLSPCMHSILASELGYAEDAFYFFYRSVRLDLENYNNNSEQGIHTASTAGAWMTFVYGFGGMQFKEDRLCFTPKIPSQWNSYSFNVRFRGRLISVRVTKDHAEFMVVSGDDLTITVCGQNVTLKTGTKEIISL